MANMFSVDVPNVLQSIMAGEQSYKDASGERKQGQIEAARADAAKALAAGDTRGALARVMAVGDIQGAHTISSLGQQDWERNFKTTEAGRAQTNADRSFGLAQQTAKIPNIVMVEDASGNKTPIRVNPDGTASAISVPGVTGGPQNNPYSYGKQNETQSKDSGYANRMFRAEGVLREPGVESAATDLTQNIKGMAPGFVANYLTSPEFQKFDQAKRDFVNAVLRRESGAAISQSEFDNANKQYFPQPGDTKEKIAEKKKNRQDAIAGVAGGGGQHYKPPFAFDQAGGMVATGNPKQGVPQSAGTAQAAPSGNDPLAQARDAIARGADPRAVAARLKQNGIDPAGL